MAKTKKTYGEKLLDPRWQKKRLEILNRDEFTCQLCGDKETTLHIHHDLYLGADPWDTPDECLITYCKTCHKVVESLSKTDWPAKAKKTVAGDKAGLVLIVISESSTLMVGVFEHDLVTDRVTEKAWLSRETIDFCNQLINR